jgi:endo-1,4-beta-D-glucanase Y
MRARAARWLGCTAALGAALVVAACGSTTPVGSRLPATVSDTAAGEAALFLDRYVAPDGRVVRIDQGGDTVSEGQAYAMLLDVATGRRSQFATVWAWSTTNLMQPDGLLAYHWEDGRIADTEPASDADLDTARALLLAGVRWNDPTWTAAGRTYAAAILGHETVELDGRTWLVAGPWARTSPYYLDPSYLDPGTFALLSKVTGDPQWNRIASSSEVAVGDDTGGGTLLPSDWATISASGRVQASAPPGGGPTVFGYDAFRTLVRQADSCTPGPVRSLDARLLPLAARTAGVADRADAYTQQGAPAEAGDNPLMLIAAAGTAGADGDTASVTAYLDRAAALEPTDGSYYFDAWVALGRYLLTTPVLSGCAP